MVIIELMGFGVFEVSCTESVWINKYVDKVIGDPPSRKRKDVIEWLKCNGFEQVKTKEIHLYGEGSIL